MKFSLSWLKDHLETAASLPEICATLNRIGLEVEGVEDPAEKLQGFRTARILSAERHPDADRLQICHVDAGPGFENVQVVCGAPNARAGLHVIFAPPGTHIPASGMTIKAGKIRGQASGGMLCSLRELGLGDEDSGIAELPADAPVGEDYARYAALDDPIIEIAITPNRGDALGVRGVARDLAAAGLGPLKPWSAPEVVESLSEAESAASPVWQISHPDCAWVTGRLIRGVRNGPSPAWLKRRLESVGLRPQSALVDVTNYLMIALGRPLHVFDADRLAGPVLTVGHGQEGETFQALNGQDYALQTQDIVIRDASGPQSLAGIMGGQSSAVDENTQNVFVESALFDPVRVALTGRRLGLQSDARYRFERGVDQARVREGLEAATALIQELCGGKAGPVVSAGAEPGWQRQASLRFARLKDLAGLDVSPDEAVTMLQGLGFELLSREAERAVFGVPSWRNDIASPAGILAQAPELDQSRAQRAAENVATAEAEADLVEEVLRLRGIDAVTPLRLPQRTQVATSALGPEQSRLNLLRRLCAGRGLMETIGFSFVSSQDAERFGGAPAGEQLLNPIAADLDQLRPTPLIPLLRALERNLARGLGQEGEAGFFELGPAFGEHGGGMVLAGVRGGQTARRPGRKGHGFGWEAARDDLTAALLAVGVNQAALTTVAEAPAYYHPGRSGQLRQGPKKVLGTFGELHPRLAREFGFAGPVAIFELALDALPRPKPRQGKGRGAPVVSPLQPVRRDFAFLAGPQVQAQDVLKAVRGAERALPQRGMISNVRLFDVFEGPGLPEGMRSLGVEVTLQPATESLTDAQLEAVTRALAEAVEKATGATLRS
ncbi:phenylalanine--tRNA ligase subunit beta [Oecophyllibacter saccharovorans]|uniref:phenylalanine--tRNA ligase subunit beta n=1 Tax=Oecophyllibacter saccharovorans TaxID=2558360 RepID=UPI00116CB2B3|nr:phenylalanine--tRNA ligase subunit beta [Oecophyllibacter saccharovorans]TPW34930.1 phenylalanine--tRNA ligase subunit beta [Oecophyllibacter saccharovorans]